MKLDAFLRLLLTALVLFAINTTTAWAQGEHARRIAAELLVIRGDAQKLQLITELPLHKTGLRTRIRGGLSGLALLMRLADQETRSTPENPEAIVTQLYQLLHEDKLTEFLQVISTLTDAFPLSTSTILIDDQTPEQLKMARNIHRENCAACHDKPNASVERPAYNLSEQAQAVSPIEFAARLLVGVRGDRMTGIGNPLLDREIAALIAYYRTN